jgi:hypothetical protein
MRRKSRRKRQPTIKQPPAASLTLNIVICLSILFGISSLWGIKEFCHFDNTRHGAGLFFLLAFSGLLLSIPFYILIYRSIPDFKKNREMNIKWFAYLWGLGMGFFLFIPAIASNINRSHLVGVERCTNNTIIRKSSTTGKYREYYLYVLIDNQEERLTVFKSYWDSVKEGQLITICLQKGILGFEYIKIEQ